jgi:hypothetical protein
MDPETPRLQLGPAERAEHLVALGRIALLQVEPDRAGVARAGLHEIGTPNDIQFRLLPRKAVFRRGIGGAALRQVPHFEELGPRIVEDAVAEDHAAGEDRVLFIILRQVVRSRQRGVRDEEVIDEELSTDVDRNHGRRRREIGRRHRLAVNIRDTRWPGRWQADAVVKHLAVRGRRLGCQGGIASRAEQPGLQKASSIQA